MKRDDKEFQAELKQQLAEIGKDEVRRVADEMGVGPLVKSAEGLMRIAVDFEADSIKMLRKAADDKFQWFRFEPHVVRLVFPVTRANAKRVAADPNSKAWLKEMRTFVQPIDLEATEEGLAIVVGKKSELIRIVYRDSGKHRPGDEAAMFKHAGSPEPILLDGKAANAEQLIERFVAEHTRRRAEPRKGPGSDE